MRLGLNQKAFGELGGATLDSQSRYETGRNLPSAEYLARLAGQGVDVLFVLTGERREWAGLDPDSAELLSIFSDLGPALQASLLTIVRTMAEQVRPGAPTLHARRPTYRSSPDT